MFLSLVAASVLPLTPIAADDARLEKRRTFVSEAAKAELEEETTERVLCLDRHRANSICLTETEWTTAIDRAAEMPVVKLGPRPFLPSYDTSIPRPRHQFLTAGAPERPSR